ncbi:Uu.00g097030.m01.CDS01 [Anthostomella pinea]|uniref:Uu.00g097030.m01.CDS01 n=1 Tax=Anthostomella pinea TaxID=933095 RepID=A0AAI8VCC4_9PEZI|nr:Uu.00g097030.m01.CDS01 [Anthostomella pinea]
MTSLYKQSIPVFVKYLNNLGAIAQKGQAFADDTGKKHEEILDFRLVPDMQGLRYQVQSCCNTAVWFADRVGELEHTAVADDETTFAQLQTRIEKTVAYLNGVDPVAIDSHADKPLIMDRGKFGKFHFDTAQTYFSEFAMPNFHFHLTSGYCILRTQGAPIGAMDYMKDVFKKV